MYDVESECKEVDWVGEKVIDIDKLTSDVEPYVTGQILLFY